MSKIIFLFISFCLSAFSYDRYDNSDFETLPLKGTETVPIGKTLFKLLKKNGEQIIDLSGQNFILVSVREPGSDGRFYAVDRDGTVWWSGAITSGTPDFRSPSGIFSIFQKKRYHMSTVFPDESGVNNMNYMMKFTPRGHALHEGSVDWMSHGCIHIDPKDVPVIYRWAKYGTKVVVTRHKYMPFAREDLLKIYGNWP
jgi:lipoprotein-anchoring transpeptidase ErfK/SrfK